MSKNRRKSEVKIEHGHGYEGNYSILIQQNCSTDVTRVVVQDQKTKALILDELLPDDLLYAIVDAVNRNGHDPGSFTDEEHEILNN